MATYTPVLTSANGDRQEAAAYERQEAASVTDSSWLVMGNRGKPRKTHPLYKKLSAISMEVNALTLVEVKEKLKNLGFSNR